MECTGNYMIEYWSTSGGSFDSSGLSMFEQKMNFKLSLLGGGEKSGSAMK